MKPGRPLTLPGEAAGRPGLAAGAGVSISASSEAGGSLSSCWCTPQTTYKHGQ